MGYGASALIILAYFTLVTAWTGECVEKARLCYQAMERTATSKSIPDVADCIIRCQDSYLDWLDGMQPNSGNHATLDCYTAFSGNLPCATTKSCSYTSDCKCMKVMDSGICADRNSFLQPPTLSEVEADTRAQLCQACAACLITSRDDRAICTICNECEKRNSKPT
jgi:hypothetical protein